MVQGKLQSKSSRTIFFFFTHVHAQINLLPYHFTTYKVLFGFFEFLINQLLRTGGTPNGLVLLWFLEIKNLVS
jgi:hypothetical protein